MKTARQGIAALGAALGAMALAAPAAFAGEPAAPATSARPTLGVIAGAQPLSRSEKTAADGKFCDAMIGRYAGYISNSRGTWHLYICEFSDGTRSSTWARVL